MANKNIEGLVEYNQSVKKQTEQNVIKAINKVRKSGKEFTLAAVCEKAGVSRSYFYKNPEMLKLIDKYRNPTGNKKIQTKDAKDVIISSQKTEIKDLKNKLNAISVNDNYKIKYEEALEKIAQLEKELEEALKMNLDLDF